MRLDRARMLVLSILTVSFLVMAAYVMAQGIGGHYGEEAFDILTGHLKVLPWYVTAIGAIMWVMSVTSKPDDPAASIRVSGLFWLCLLALLTAIGLQFGVLTVEYRINLPPGDFLTYTSFMLGSIQLLAGGMIGKLIVAK